MSKISEGFCALFLAVYVVAMLIKGISLTWPFGAILLALGILYPTFLSHRVQRKRAKQGFWVSYSNREVHDVIYYEGSRQLQFHGVRYPDEYILYFPSVGGWQKHMPDWAKDRRETILQRVVEELQIKKLKKFSIECSD